ncbi:aminopeptidase P family protein [Oceaniradius stylonematis]|uniref:Aminopeptidase P family protein n=1 Tax=Oceaniradius stylonematis TaxID=2184161 RepID=A0A3A8A8T1_9HYPH|nr:Xaa-Pro peptidase family protein [Oceaniradius stylonematis]RKF05748.1 aminopeptidase P family protein [Oceaniradius stylonematis]
MVERSLVFPAAEFRRRVAGLQAQMDDAELNALLLTTPADIFYVTGFLTRFWESPARPWFVIVPASGDPVAVIPAIGAALMGRSWVRDIRSWDAPDPDDDGVSLLAEALCEMVPEGGRIGVPMGEETHLRMPLATYDAVSGRIGPRRFVDATEPVRRVREIKSEPEIERIRAVCAVADAAFARVPEIAHGAGTLAGLFRSFQAALLAAGADWVSYLAGGAGRDGYGDVISPAEERPLQRGEVLMLDTGAVKDGYFCDFDRNYAVGRPTDAVLRAHAALFAATDTALDAVRPGMSARAVHGLLSASLRAHGATPAPGRFGHGLGISLTEWPSISPKDETILREGMVLTLEPGAEVVPGRFMVHEENIVLRAGGPELLSKRAPAELPELVP